MFVVVVMNRIIAIHKVYLTIIRSSFSSLDFKQDNAKARVRILIQHKFEEDWREEKDLSV